MMRAMRFVAQLEFELDAETEAAIAPALPSLAKVSRERVADELRKLLAAREPSRGLADRGAHRDHRDDLAELDVRSGTSNRLAIRVGSIGRIRVCGSRRWSRRSRDREAPSASSLKALKFSNAEAELAARSVGG